MTSNILLITNKDDITTDFIVKKLKDRQLSFYRFNTEEIGNNVTVNLNFSNESFVLYDKNKKESYNLLDFHSVYFRRPEIGIYNHDLTKGEHEFIKSEILFTLEGIYKILRNAFWISCVDSIRKAENKIYQQLIAKQIGFLIPNSIITNEPSSAKGFYLKNNSKCIIKPIKSGLINGDEEEGVVFTSAIEINDSNIFRISDCPIYLQNLIEKEADVRVTVVGDRVFAALIHSQENSESKIDWRKTEGDLTYSAVELPEKVQSYCLELTRSLSLNFAAIDFILMNDGNYIFLEINPNGQWAWIEKQLNYKISDEIVSLLAKK